MDVDDEELMRLAEEVVMEGCEGDTEPEAGWDCGSDHAASPKQLHLTPETFALFPSLSVGLLGRKTESSNEETNVAVLRWNQLEGSAIRKAVECTIIKLNSKNDEKYTVSRVTKINSSREFRRSVQANVEPKTGYGAASEDDHIIGSLKKGERGKIVVGAQRSRILVLTSFMVGNKIDGAAAFPPPAASEKNQKKKNADVDSVVAASPDQKINSSSSTSFSQNVSFDTPVSSEQSVLSSPPLAPSSNLVLLQVNSPEEEEDKDSHTTGVLGKIFDDFTSLVRAGLAWIDATDIGRHASINTDANNLDQAEKYVATLKILSNIEPLVQIISTTALRIWTSRYAIAPRWIRKDSLGVYSWSWDRPSEEWRKQTGAERAEYILENTVDLSHLFPLHPAVIFVTNYVGTGKSTFLFFTVHPCTINTRKFGCVYNLNAAKSLLKVYGSVASLLDQTEEEKAKFIKIQRLLQCSGNSPATCRCSQNISAPPSSSAIPTSTISTSTLSTSSTPTSTVVFSTTPSLSTVSRTSAPSTPTLITFDPFLKTSIPISTSTYSPLLPSTDVPKLCVSQNSSTSSESPNLVS